MPTIRRANPRQMARHLRGDPLRAYPTRSLSPCLRGIIDRALSISFIAVVPPAEQDVGTLIAAIIAGRTHTEQPSSDPVPLRDGTLGVQ